MYVYYPFRNSNVCNVNNELFVIADINMTDIIIQKYPKLCLPQYKEENHAQLSYLERNGAVVAIGTTNNL